MFSGEKAMRSEPLDQKYNHVIVVGIDGAGAFIRDADTPYFDRVFENGAVTYHALSSNPTISAECWGSMLLGVGPEVHKLTNRIVDTEPYPVDAPIPTVFRRIREACPEAELGCFCDWNPITAGIVEQNLNVAHDTAPDTALTPVICDYIRTKKPDFLFIQFDSVDGAGHANGYGTAPHLQRIHEVDALVYDVYTAVKDAGMLPDTLFMVIADHGGTNPQTGRGSHGGWTDGEKYVTFAAAGKGVRHGEIAQMNIRDLAAIVLYAFGLNAPDFDETGWTSQIPADLFDDAAVPPYRDISHLTGAAPRISTSPHQSSLTELSDPLLRFFVITDTHFFKLSLGASGKAYEARMDYEQKCLAETEAINRAVLQYLADSDEADIVLIAGDLSQDGEKESHRAFSAMLRDFRQKSGKKVYIVTAGHDCNASPRAYNDNGEYTPEGTDFSELYDLYRDFGYDDAIAFQREHLSYVADLNEDVRLLVLCSDTAEGARQPYTDSFLQWIEAQAKKAQADGKMMIAMQHYPVLAGQPVFALIDDARQPDAQRLLDLLADNGVHLIFTGHMHNQSINAAQTKSGSKFYDVCTGSVIGCPAFMRLVTVRDRHTVDIQSIPIPEFAWDKKGLSGEAYLKAQFERMIRTFLCTMQTDPDRFLRKIGIKSTPATQKLTGILGKKLSALTVGQAAKLFMVRADPSVRDNSFVELLIEIVRTVFEGNQPFVEGTPEGDVMLRIFKRLRPFIKTLKGTQGELFDFYELMKHTIGNYGINDNHAVLRL